MLRTSRRPSTHMATPLRTRRFKPLIILVVFFVLIILYLTSSARSTRNSDFYTRTQAALQQQRFAADSADDVISSDANVAARLKEAEEQAKKSADKKGDEHRARLGMEELPPADKEKDQEKSVAGRKTMKDESSKKGLVLDDDADDAYVAAGVEKPSKDQVPVKGKEQTAATEEDDKVEAELNSILKRSPSMSITAEVQDDFLRWLLTLCSAVIIFSKTYCPYSKKAKRILLDQYKITPAPYVVELDEHPLGAKMQAALGTSTGRRTVPNILINGKSVGGGDDIALLHEKGTLISTIKDMGKKRIMEATLIEPKPAPKDDGKRRRVKR